MARTVTAMLVIMLAICPVSSTAKEAAPLANDPALEARVLAIAEELRCLVCQNETIAASHADLAVDLRRQIGQQLRAGRTQPQIIDYMVARYGEFVRYRPAFNPTTALLWTGPFALLMFAAMAMTWTIRQRRRGLPKGELSETEALRVRQLLARGGDPA